MAQGNENLPVDGLSVAGAGEIFDALDRAGVGLALSDAQDRFVWSNDYHARLYGQTCEEIIGKSWRDFVSPQEAAAAEQLCLPNLLRGEVCRTEIPSRGADGTLRYHLVTDIPLLDERGVYRGHVCIVQDHTEAKRAREAEEARLQSEEQARMERERANWLVEVSRLKDEFLSLASHELKTPITSIRLFAEMASRHPEAVKAKFLETLVREADQLSRLINDLLDVSRLQLGRVPMAMETIDLASLASQVCERYQSLYDKGHALSCLAPERPLMVKGDPVRLAQVLSNLLDNAVKYSPEGAAIEVRVKRRGAAAVIEVSDQGIGITPEALPHVFERFFKPLTQQAVYGGLGLGLYICKEIIERHGGRIWADSVPGEGSTFYVELPLAGGGE